MILSRHARRSQTNRNEALVAKNGRPDCGDVVRAQMKISLCPYSAPGVALADQL
jgi:hypothetical protein